MYNKKEKVSILKNEQTTTAQSRGEQLVLERVRAEIYEKYLPKKEKYKHVGGSIFNTSKFLFYVFSVWYFVVVVLNLFISSLAVERYSNSSNSQKLAQYSNDRLMTLLMLVLLVVSFVLMIKKKRKLASILSLADGVALAVHIFQISSVYPLNSSNDYQTANPGIIIWLYVPAFLAAVFALVVLIIELRDARLERAAFEKETAKIYERFSVDGQLMDEEKWLEVVSEYEQQKKQGEG